MLTVGRKVNDVPDEIATDQEELREKMSVENVQRVNRNNS